METKQTRKHTTPQRCDDYLKFTRSQHRLLCVQVPHSFTMMSSSIFLFLFFITFPKFAFRVKSYSIFQQLRMTMGLRQEEDKGAPAVERWRYRFQRERQRGSKRASDNKWRGWTEAPKNRCSHCSRQFMPRWIHLWRSTKLSSSNRALISWTGSNRIEGHALTISLYLLVLCIWFGLSKQERSDEIASNNELLRQRESWEPHPIFTPQKEIREMIEAA